MTRPGTDVAALRQLIASRFPEKAKTSSGVVATGVAALDEALGGGLACGRLTEWVALAPSGGSQLALAALLGSARKQGLRVAWVDGADGFDPETLPLSDWEHVVWVRCGTMDLAMATADLLVRDGNLPLVVLDVRGLPEREVRRWPATAWYRLHRAAESGSCAVVVAAEVAVVPAVPQRLVFENSLPGLELRLAARQELAEQLAPRVARGAALQAQGKAG